MDRLKIVFMGTPEFAVPSLKALLEDNFNIVAVVSQPDKQRGRGRKISFSPVKEYAVSKNIEVLQPAKMTDDDFIKRLTEIDPDLFVVVAFRILPDSVLQIPKIGSINLHASLLPKYRGAAPINHALFNGDDKTGVTVFFLNNGEVDSGKIIDQLSIDIDNEDDYGSLYYKMSQMGSIFLSSSVEKICNGKYSLKEQDFGVITKAPKIFEKDLIINWSDSAVNIHNKIRGLAPKPGAYTFYNNSVFKILKSRVIDQESTLQPGALVEVIKKQKLVTVSCGEGLLALEIVQPSGKKAMDVASFLNGNKIETGEKFGE
ncbi:MAG: methionyl-tRNA formyltransferase [Candidatus Delongbacteria bacterium]|nr:methionyl-tRNA formyltransferase [Candidatus Delongbacteria bacterium]MBN2835268.1 methionyl-tRNA formyltransferase [Candidatus Delongbacteria bacterium]